MAAVIIMTPIKMVIITDKFNFYIPVTFILGTYVVQLVGYVIVRIESFKLGTVILKFYL